MKKLSRALAITLLAATVPTTIVLADPESETIGAAVALAAGHFQPLVRVGRYHLPPGAPGA